MIVLDLDTSTDTTWFGEFKILFLHWNILEFILACIKSYRELLPEYLYWLNSIASYMV